MKHTNTYVVEWEERVYRFAHVEATSKEDASRVFEREWEGGGLDVDERHISGEWEEKKISLSPARTSENASRKGGELMKDKLFTLQGSQKGEDER